MSISGSERELLVCLPLGAEEGQDSPFVSDLDVQHSVSRASQRFNHHRASDTRAQAASTSSSASLPAADLSRALSAEQPQTNLQPALPGSTSSSLSGISKTAAGPSGSQNTQHTSPWLLHADSAGMTLQASAEGCFGAPATGTYQSGPMGSRAAQQQDSTGASSAAAAAAALLTRAGSEQLYQQQQQQQQQHGNVSAPNAAARARTTSQRSASLDLLSPTATQALFPSLTAPAPDPLALPRLAMLSPEQYQMLVNSSMDPSSLAAAAAAAAATSTPTTPAETQLDAAEALWQQVAASGADDQTLISLAMTLGLITSDGTGGMMLARETRHMRTGGAGTPASATAAAAALRNPLMMQNVASLQGLYSGSILDAAAAVAASPRLAGSDSAPLPSLANTAALAGLLNVCGSMRLATASTPGSASKPLGSPGPGPSKQHTLYKTELCRGWLEAGTCRYGSKCQFAHGPEELRPVPRHPKYKTEVCRSFTATGVCAYGPRCRFIHGTVSAPNALLCDQPGSARFMTEGLEGLEGVLGFEDISPTGHPQVSSAGRNVVSPSGRGMLGSLTGPSMALRQAQGTGLTQSMLAAAAAAAANPQLTAQDAAAMTRLGRLLSTPAAGSSRTSLDSAISMAMARTALLGQSGSQSDMRRSSMSDVPRSSLDSRGRTSIESSQSQLDSWAQQAGSGQDTPVGPFASPLKPASLDLVASHQPYMPGIPEGYAMPSIPHHPNEPWATGARASGPSPTSAPCNLQQQQVSPTGDLSQLHGLAGFSFQPAPGAQTLIATVTNRQASGDGSGAGRWFPGGQWWSLSGKASEGMTSGASSSEQLPSGSAATNSGSTLQSAYSSGLYASATPAQAAAAAAQLKQQQQQAGSALRPGSASGLLTPEKSDSSTLGPGSEMALASMLGLGL